MKKLVLSFLALAAVAEAAAPPTRINYQGVLRNAAGAPLSGSYDMNFLFYDAASGGTLLWQEYYAAGGYAPPVTVSNGLFSIALGDPAHRILGSESTFSNVFRSHTDVYLAIRVGADPEMTPRVKVVSAPYALSAESIQGLSATDFLRRDAADVSTASSPTDLYRFVNSSTAAGATSLRAQMSNDSLASGNFYAIAAESNRNDNGGSGPVYNTALSGSAQGSSTDVNGQIRNYGLSASANSFSTAGESRNFGVSASASGGDLNYGLYGSASGSGGNRGVYAYAAGGSSNYAIHSECAGSDCYGLYTPNAVYSGGKLSVRGDAGGSVSDSSLSIYPNGALGPNAIVLGVGYGGNDLFRLDLEGDIFMVGSLDLGGGANDDLTAADVTDLTDGGTTTLHAHASLSANGTNCSAGNYPLGVDASGNAEGCTAAPTDAGTLDGLDSTDFLRRNSADSSSASVASGALYTLSNTSTSMVGATVLNVSIPDADLPEGDFYGVFATVGRNSTGGSRALVNIGVAGRTDGNSANSSGDVLNIGSRGIADGNATSGAAENRGIFGLASGDGAFVTNYGLYGSADGFSGAMNYGVYGKCSGAGCWGLYTPNSASIGGDPTGTSVSAGSLYVNPTTANVDETILGVADNGTQLLRIDREGDTYITGALSVSGNAILGDASTDTLSFNARAASHLLPSTSATYSLGSSTNRWLDIHLGGTLDLGAGTSDDLTATDVTDLTDGGTTTLHAHTALSANGTNCGAGNYPLGVDASGNAEGCTALPTDAGTLDGLDSIEFWRRTGNAGTTPGTHFLGTTDNQALELKVNGRRGLRVSPIAAPYAPNVIGGIASNAVTSGARSATIGGGGWDDGVSTSVNTVSDDFGTVGGGDGNHAGDTTPSILSAVSATVGGGSTNTAGASYATIAGGAVNSVSAAYGTIGGGNNNTASGSLATIGGGDGNTATTSNATVAGGSSNDATGPASTIAGGSSNLASGQYSTVAGGSGNTASGSFSIVAGGVANVAAGYGSFAGGTSAEANHNGAFVWSDATGIGLVSTGINQFLIRAGGGVGIGTDSPASALHVSGSTGSADLRIEADTDNFNEADQPSLTLTQDGGTVIGKIGFFSSTNDFSVTNSSGSGSLSVRGDGVVATSGAVSVGGDATINGWDLSGASGGYLVLHSDLNCDFFVDNDNNSTTDVFQWWKNGTTVNTNKLADLDQNGLLRIRSTIQQSVAFDTAESFLAGEPLSPGELVRIDPTRRNRVLRTRGESDIGLLGVVSTEPGLLLGGAPFDVPSLGSTWGPDVETDFRARQPELRARRLAADPELAARFERLADDPESRLRLEAELESQALTDYFASISVPVALSGRVPVKVDASITPIAVGDRLAPGSTPGTAVKATKTGPTIGTALEALDSGEATILAFIHRGDFVPSAVDEAIDEVAKSISDRTPDPTSGVQSLAGNLEIALDRGADDRARFSIQRDGRGGLGAEVFRVDEEGNVYTRGAVRPSSLDLAEYHPVDGPFAVGDVLVASIDQPGRLRRSDSASDPAVVGIVSGAPGLLLGSGLDRIAGADPVLAERLAQARAAGDTRLEAALWQELEAKFRATHAALALSGTVPCRVDAAYGAIRVGDLLVASPTPGHAMRAPRPVEPGTVVGKALEPRDAGTGLVQALVMLR